LPLKIGVIGGGAYGCSAALHLAGVGYSVTMIEQKSDLLLGATYNNQNRLHRGYHYPTDPSTIEECRVGYDRFETEFGECVVRGFSNLYFIAHDSPLSAEQFAETCREFDLPFEPWSGTDGYPKTRNVSAGFKVDESVYDIHRFRALVTKSMRARAVTVLLNSRVEHIEKFGRGFRLHSHSNQTLEFDVVINCTFADVNRLTNQLGYPELPMRIERTAIAIVEPRWTDPVGITVILGHYTTVLPFGSSRTEHLVYHVDHSRDVLPDLSEWYHELLLPACAEYVPSLADATLKGFLSGPRALPDEPGVSRVYRIETSPDPAYIAVRSGKVGNCVEAADKITRHVRANFW